MKRLQSNPSAIFCDFDGTLIQVDGTDAVLDRFALPEWRDWETAWVAGEVTTQECLLRQTELLRVGREELRVFASRLPLDEGIFRLDQECKSRGIPLTIVSDGLDVVAQAVLEQHDLEHLPVFSNELIWRASGGASLRFPNASASCTSKAGTCKCAKTSAIPGEANQIVYIGDGRSDFCVAGKGHIVFAKGSLQTWCAEQQVPFEAFETLDQVVDRLFLRRVRVA